MTEATKPDLAERYTSAVGTSNLRVQAERSSPADMVIAAGMNQHRLGMALRRLATEWDCVGKPRSPSDAYVRAIAATIPRIPGDSMVEYHGKRMTPLQAARKEADRWYSHELGLMFQRLKTLPEVRAALIQWAADKGMEGPEHIVGAVLQWWLAPACPVCHGVKKKIIHGTGRTSSKDCGECKGSGERKLPHGLEGRRVLAHMQNSMNAAVVGLRKRFNRP